MNDERLKRLEEKLAFLEHHVTEQDKVILELGEELVRLRRELKKGREEWGGRGGPSSAGGEGDSGDERPPHY